MDEFSNNKNIYFVLEYTLYTIYTKTNKIFFAKNLKKVINSSHLPRYLFRRKKIK